MSKQLSVRMYLKRQKQDAEGKVPIYVHVTVDGDEDDFSLSCKTVPKVLAIIDQYLQLKTREKKAQKMPAINHLLENIQLEKEGMVASIESFLQDGTRSSRSWRQKRECVSK